jgi:hypothetical protein
LYQKDPVNRHHWRAKFARPSTEIDLDPKKGGQSSTAKITSKETDKPPPDLALNTNDDSLDFGLIARGLVAESIVKLNAYSLSQSLDYDFDDFDGGYGSERSAEDFAACNSDCGDCGDCDY